MIGELHTLVCLVTLRKVTIEEFLTYFAWNNSLHQKKVHEHLGYCKFGVNFFACGIMPNWDSVHMIIICVYFKMKGIGAYALIGQLKKVTS
ncbi:hypothetical protein RhiirC2_801052 [Rhizophagus irregularis]|uniref:Uncharacterized protein n=1 Tax=Rhizophagus irregularis TaxID=588596 RepID=A0A2N1M2V0_9GLOM|nr:hypothetical protein RhiirC2_801052 [Rhizophagus irregularis]